MKDRIAIVCGVRTPFCKSGGVMRHIEPDDLGAFVVSELNARSNVPSHKIDELIFGNVLQPVQSANIARIIAIKAGLQVQCAATTVNRNCASGLESVVTAADKIRLGMNEIVIAGGVESMSNFPISIRKDFKEFLQNLNKARGFKQRLLTLMSFRLKFLMPEVPDLTDPLCGLSMGQTAEVLAREFRITRQDQDQYALMSQTRAFQAASEGRLADEIAPIPIPPDYKSIQINDDGPRANQTIESLEKLKPSFDREMGSVTAGNSSQITDGAAALLLMSESKAKELGLTPLGYICDYAVSGLPPNRMGLGPVFAISKLLQKTGRTLSDFDLIEINEAFAAQVLAVVRAAASDTFAQKELGRTSALGVIDLNKLNVNGGAIALGHPLGATGTRLILTMLKELKRRKKTLGLVSVCIGGGQGQAVIVEVS